MGIFSKNGVFIQLLRIKRCRDFKGEAVTCIQPRVIFHPAFIVTWFWLIIIRYNIINTNYRIVWKTKKICLCGCLGLSIDRVNFWMRCFSIITLYWHFRIFYIIIYNVYTVIVFNQFFSLSIFIIQQYSKTKANLFSKFI